MRPLHSVAGVGSGALAVVLGEEGCVQPEGGGVPRQPACAVDVRLDGRSEEDADRVFLPRPAQEGRVAGDAAFQVAGAVEVAVLERQARVLVRVDPALRRVRVLLP